MKKSIAQKQKRHNQKVERVTESFTGKNLTRLGGTPLIRRFLERYRIEEQLAEQIEVEGRRESSYSVARMFVSLLYGILLGYCRPYHMEVLSTDRVFQKLAGVGDFPAQSTISRFLSRLKMGVAHQIAKLNLNLLMTFRNRFEGWSTLTLDLDSHVTPVYGRQQRSGVGYNPKKKGRPSYHPLLCFIGETRDYLGGFLRNGKHHTSYHAIPFLKTIIKRVPAHIQKLRLHPPPR